MNRPNAKPIRQKAGRPSGDACRAKHDPCQRDPAVGEPQAVPQDVSAEGPDGRAGGAHQRGAAAEAADPRSCQPHRSRRRRAMNARRNGDPQPDSHRGSDGCEQHVEPAPRPRDGQNRQAGQDDPGRRSGIDGAIGCRPRRRMKIARHRSGEGRRGQARAQPCQRHRKAQHRCGTCQRGQQHAKGGKQTCQAGQPPFPKPGACGERQNDAQTVGRKGHAADPSGCGDAKRQVHPDLWQEKPVGKARQPIGQRRQRKGRRDQVDPRVHGVRVRAASTSTFAACRAALMIERSETLAAAVAPSKSSQTCLASAGSG